MSLSALLPLGLRFPLVSNEGRTYTDYGRLLERRRQVAQRRAHVLALAARGAPDGREAGRQVLDALRVSLSPHLAPELLTSRHGGTSTRKGRAAA